MLLFGQIFRGRIEHVIFGVLYIKLCCVIRFQRMIRRVICFQQMSATEKGHSYQVSLFYSIKFKNSVYQSLTITIT